MKDKKDLRCNILFEIFDTMFVMLLCFGTLLTAMIMDKSEIGSTNYSISPLTFSATVIIVILYLLFTIYQSEKGLKEMLFQLYKNENVKFK
jgi:hypothetical protein